MLIAGGYDLLSEPARSAAEYAQWRQAKTMTLGEKSFIIYAPLENCPSFHIRPCCIRFNLRFNILVIKATKGNNLGRTFGNANSASLTKCRINFC